MITSMEACKGNAVSESTKRSLSSPHDPNEYKKNRSSDDSVEASPVHMGSLESSMTEAVERTQSLILDEASIQSIALALKSSMEATLEAMIKSALAGAMESQRKQITDLQAVNRQLRESNAALCARVAKLESAADSSEQYSRRNSIRLSGVRETHGEDTDAVVMGIFQSMGSDININEIDRSHRVGMRRQPEDPEDPQRAGGNGERRRPPKPREIIVKFSTYRARQKIYKIRAQLKQCGYGGVYINDDLTKTRSELLYEARKMVKGNTLLVGAWSSDGNILVKTVKNKQFSVHRIRSAEDLRPFYGQ